MRELSIKIKIGDREYPMKVSAEEEARIRYAGRIVNEKLKAYREKFNIDDKQDLLAMVSFDLAVEKLQKDELDNINSNGVLEKVSMLNHLISQAL